MDMIMLYKIIHGLDGSPFDTFLRITIYPQDLVATNYLKSFVILTPESIYSFSQWVINDWNSLPADVVQAPNVDSFKFKLDLFWTQYRFVFD